MHKRWVIHFPKHPDKVVALVKELQIPAALSAILVDRSVEDFESAKCFFRPSFAQLHDPFLMQGMEQAVERLIQAVAKKEKILVYGDYDVDGTTAVAMVYDFMQRLSVTQVRYYIPDRLVEGYGVSRQAIDVAYQNGIHLIITLDCGIKAYESLAYAASLGIDVIVCDHHEVGDVLPHAYAILDPKQPTCPYPFKELSGCGIGFKLLQALCQKKHLPDEIIYPYLDLVAVSTACDVVPLVGENRILAYHGIQQLERNPRPGLQALMQFEAFSSPISIADIAFKIGPRINVPGRISHAGLTVQLLIAQNKATAHELAQIINQQNCVRRELDHSVTQDALSIIKSELPAIDQKSHVLFKPDWHKGIIGIVASRCIEQYYKPTIILTFSEGKVTGSARSIPGYNIYQAIHACSDLLYQYGGHAFAAGLSMPLENISDFQYKFNKVVSETIADHLLIPQQTIHALIVFQEITQKFVNILMQMAPFGVGNPTPVFASNQVYAHKCYVLKNKHLKLELYQMGCKQRYSAIGFGLASYESLVAGGQPFSIAYTIGYNVYLGNKELQLIVKDIKKDTYMLP